MHEDPVIDATVVPIIGFIYSITGRVVPLTSSHAYDELFKKYELFKYNSTFIMTELYILLYSLESYNGNITNSKHKVYIFEHTFDIKEYATGYIMENILYEHTPLTSLTISNSHKELMNPLKKFIKVSHTDQEQQVGMGINFANMSVCVSSEVHSKDKMLEVFNSFITNEVQIKSSSNKNIKIYSIKLDEVQDKTLVDNPDYSQYEEKKVLLMSHGKDPRDHRTNHVSSDAILNLHIPPKHITTMTCTKKITEEFIADRYKNYKNLFLREKDKELLYNTIHQFKHNKSVFEDLYLQYKLNILLHGQMGCGKSTTIIAIASLLQRDIYYLNLNNIDTNENLKLLLDHVNKNCKGIIVIEDIDVQTDIVKKRRHGAGTPLMPLTELSATEVSETLKHKLTLEFFLNYLQGTLTKDNTIFIMTTQFIDDLDEALVRPMRMDCIIEFKMCDHHQIKEIFKQFLERDIKDTILLKIKEDRWTPSDIIAVLRNYVSNKSVPDEEILKPFLE